MNSNYKASKSNIKGLKTAVLIFLSLITAGLEIRYPAVYAIIGYLLTFGYDWLKHYWQIELP